MLTVTLVQNQRIGLRSGCRCPGRRSIFPLVICQWPLSGAIRIHHKELGIGLRNVVVERCLIFESKTGAAEENMLSIGRPYLVCRLLLEKKKTSKVVLIVPRSIHTTYCTHTLHEHYT